jgi:hypothetical protein
VIEDGGRGQDGGDAGQVDRQQGRGAGMKMPGHVAGKRQHHA